MDEAIRKAAQAAQQLSSDLRDAYQAAAAITRPEGRTTTDKVVLAHLSRLMGESRILREKLNELV